MSNLKIIDADTNTEIGIIVEVAIGGFMWRKTWDGRRMVNSGAKIIVGSRTPNKSLEAVKASAVRSLGNIRFEEAM